MSETVETKDQENKDGYIVVDTYVFANNQIDHQRKFEVHKRPKKVVEGEIVYPDIESAEREAARRTTVEALTGKK